MTRKKKGFLRDLKNEKGEEVGKKGFRKPSKMGGSVGKSSGRGSMGQNKRE